jgi:hypothetical protein
MRFRKVAESIEEIETILLAGLRAFGWHQWPIDTQLADPPDLNAIFSENDTFVESARLGALRIRPLAPASLRSGLGRKQR